MLKKIGMLSILIFLYNYGILDNVFVSIPIFLYNYGILDNVFVMGHSPRGPCTIAI